MDAMVLARQFIIDKQGNPVGVILPLDQFALVKEILEQRFPAANESKRMHLMEQAADDPQFMADLRATMQAFSQADSEWWGPSE